MQPHRDISLASVRIACLDNRCAGAGFLVGPRTVLTCTQVVNRALGRSVRETRVVPGEIRLSFPFISSTTQYLANIVFWDVKRSIAGLRLPQELPIETAPTGLMVVKGLWGLPIQTIGYPENSLRGVRTSGMVVGLVTGDTARIKAVNGSRSLIDAGYTGAPVFDNLHQGLIGMLSGIDDARDETLMLTAAVLSEAWPGLKDYSTTPSQTIDLASYCLQDEEIARINHNFVRPKGYPQVQQAMQENRLIFIVGKPGIGKETCVKHIAINQVLAKQVLVFPRYTSWEMICQQDIVNSIILLPEAFGQDRLDRQDLDSEMIYLEQLIKNGNQVVVTLTDNVYAQAAVFLHPPGGTYKYINPKFVYWSETQYEAAEIVKISKRLLRKADDLRIVSKEQRRWAISVEKDRKDLAARLMPADVEHYIFYSLGTSTSRMGVEERLRREVEADGGLDDWFMNLEPACQVFLLTLCIFAGFPNDELWDRYQRISLNLRPLNPNLTLTSLGILRQQCYPYVTTAGPADFASEKYARRIRQLVVVNLREYFLETLNLLRNWVSVDSSSAYPADNLHVPQNQLPKFDRVRRETTGLVIAEMVGEAAKFGLEDVRLTLESWADDASLQIGPDLVGVALFRMSADPINAKKALALLQSWEGDNIHGFIHSFQRQAAIAASAGWIILANPKDNDLQISLLRILYRLARNKDAPEIVHQVAKSTVRMSRIVDWDTLLPVMAVLGKSEKSITLRQVAYALDGAHFAGKPVFPLLQEWCQSENVMTLWAGVYSVLLFGMRMDRNERHSLLSRALFKNPAQVANAIQVFLEEPSPTICLIGFNVIKDFSQLPPVGDHLMLVTALNVAQDKRPGLIDDLYRKLVTLDPGTADAVLAETRVIGYIARIEDPSEEGTRSLGELLENDLREPMFTRRSWRVLELLARGYAGPGLPRLVQPLTAAIQLRNDCIKLWNQRLLEQPNEIVEGLRNDVFIENQRQINYLAEQLIDKLSNQPAEAIQQIERGLQDRLRASVAWSALVSLVSLEQPNRVLVMDGMSLFIMESSRRENGLEAIRQVAQQEPKVKSALIGAYQKCLKMVRYPYTDLFNIKGDLFLDLFYQLSQDGEIGQLAMRRLNSLGIPRKLTLTGRRNRLVEKFAEGVESEGGENAFMKLDFLENSEDASLALLKEEIISHYHARFDIDIPV